MRQRHRNIINGLAPKYMYEDELPEEFSDLNVPLVSKDVSYDGDGYSETYARQIGIVVYRRMIEWGSLWELDYGRSEVFID